MISFNHISNRFDRVSASVVTLVSALFLLLGVNCASEQNSGSNLLPFTAEHLEYLTIPMMVRGTDCEVVYIYCEAPDYKHVGDDDEGMACVDDAARAARFWLNEFERTGDSKAKERAWKLLQFLLVMQADDGEFYNFILEDGTINTTGPPSVRKALDWWTARAFRSLALGWRLFKDSDKEKSEILARSLEKSLTRLETHFLKQPDPDLTIYGPDKCAVYSLGLLECRTLFEKRADQLILFFTGRIDDHKHTFGTDPQYTVHTSWKNIWHAWGALQVEALARSGKALGRQDWIQQAEAEGRGFFASTLQSGIPNVFEIEDNKLQNLELYPQIAYGIGSVVHCQISLFDASGDSTFLVLAGLTASWFNGQNAASQPMFEPVKGYGFDGLLSPEKINRNAGAESTIEALLALQNCFNYKYSLEFIDAIKLPGKEPDRVSFENKTDKIHLIRKGSEWTINLEPKG